jgi:hypothetical protein
MRTLNCQGVSCGMGTGVMVIYTHSVDMHVISYKRLMKVVQAKQYGEQVEKLQCIGHVWEVMGLVFIGCEKNKRERIV